MRIACLNDPGREYIMMLSAIALGMKMEQIVWNSVSEMMAF